MFIERHRKYIEELQRGLIDNEGDQSDFKETIEQKILPTDLSEFEADLEKKFNKLFGPLN